MQSTKIMSDKPTDDKKSAKPSEATPEATAAAEPVRNLDITPPQVRNFDQPVKAKVSGVKVFARDGTTREVKKK
jgi:hypothetical protein